MDCSVYAGIPFCPTRCSYCSFVSRTVGDKATRALVQPYVDKLCEELTAIRETADRCGLHIRTFYIGGGTPTSLSAPQLEQLMSHIAKTFDLAKLDEYTVEAGRPDCTDAEKLRIIKQYGATRISINPQTFSDEVLRNIGRRHTAHTRALVQPYVDKLCEELTAIRETADRCGLHIRTFYIGGGTPTSLSAPQLEQLMSHIAKTFDLAKLDEYTVEAGRPDCTDAEKLRIIKQYGATRISINPQTFSDEVLRNIGRRHTAQDIVDCFAAARAAGHTNINMDLIAGLPGDTVEGFEASLRKAIALDPENITVHTLTLKRASNIVVEHRAADYADVAAMLDKCSLLADAGYRPYYMYRQKGTLQNLENIGWAKPGFACLYNIYIMEEVHTILSAAAPG